ncbi:MAG TPA: hypothetical protein GXZ24_04285 [Firmicutes bacterium]|jgi:outer membrane lipoprotein SlyB|nr:hypothetical protein [Bacillota bacterium]
MAKAVVGVFRSEERAREAINELKRQGFDEREISLIARDHRQEGGGKDTGGDGDQGLTMGEQNVGDGALTGGAIGGIAGLLAGAGALLIPGVGPIVAAGPLAAFLTGIVGGGLVGSLVDFGIPEESGRHLEERVKQGDILVTLKANEDETSKVSSVLKRFGAEDVESY